MWIVIRYIFLLSSWYSHVKIAFIQHTTKPNLIYHFKLISFPYPNNTTRRIYVTSTSLEKNLDHHRVETLPWSVWTGRLPLLLLLRRRRVLQLITGIIPYYDSHSMTDVVVDAAADFKVTQQTWNFPNSVDYTQEAVLVSACGEKYTRSPKAITNSCFYRACACGTQSTHVINKDGCYDVKFLRLR